MKSNYRGRSLLATVGAWSLLLALLLTLVGCDGKKPGGEDSPSEEHTTARQPSANDFPSAPDLDDPNDEILNNGGNEDSSTTEKPAPVAPPALVTNRFAGQGDAGVASGTFYSGDHWFYATVLDVGGDTVEVQPYKTAEERQVADRILVNTATTNSGYTVPAFYKGSLIMVVYDGVIIPGTPPKILAPVRFEAYVHGFGGNGVDYFCAGAYKIGYFANEKIYNSPLNQSAEKYSPVYHITSVAELMELMDLFVHAGFANSGMINWRSDMEDFVLSSYGEEYFAENDLVVAYCTESSGSNRISVEQVTVADGAFCMIVRQDVPQGGTCDMAGWFATVEVAKEAVEGVSSFSAITREVISREGT